MVQVREDEQLQAALHAARERTKMHRGFVLDLPRSHHIFGSTVMATTIPAGTFKTRDAICTFKSRIEFDTAAPTGQILSFGDATGAISMYVETTAITFRAGGATIATNANEAQLTIAPVAGDQMTVVGMVRPDGLVGLWIPELQKITWSSAGSFSTWANDIVGDFAQAATGMPADVAQTGNPTNFTVVEPLSVYYGSLPRVNIGAEKV